MIEHTAVWSLAHENRKVILWLEILPTSEQERVVAPVSLVEVSGKNYLPLRK